MTYLFNDTGTRMSTVLRGMRSELEKLLYDSLHYQRRARTDRRKGTYGRIGVGLAARYEGRDSSIRVDLQEVGVEVLSLVASGLWSGAYPLAERSQGLRHTSARVTLTNSTSLM